MFLENTNAHAKGYERLEEHCLSQIFQVSEDANQTLGFPGVRNWVTLHGESMLWLLEHCLTSKS